MEYKFNVAWFVIGFLVICGGGLLARYHQWVADNLGGGIGSYDRYKLAAFIMIGVGFLFMLNLHTLILGWIFSALFDGMTNG